MYDTELIFIEAQNLAAQSHQWDFSFSILLNLGPCYTIVIEGYLGHHSYYLFPVFSFKFFLFFDHLLLD